MANRLAQESSPYLLQHKDNPVDWYAWGPEALARAHAEDKPILLSIGYSACHWCHVMEHESFEDAQTAALMNEHFVSIKVDREERPDLDAIYMAAVQRLTGHGGWPMTMFLTPDGRPFYGGTYFPPVPRHGMPSFRQLLGAITDTYRKRREDVERSAGDIAAALVERIAVPDSLELSEDLLAFAARALGSEYDSAEGGFGGAPKFPQPMAIEFLLRAHRHGVPRALA
ncbi:MAG TPA: thioredoxin domain-containing protein, partial [Chloroflexota bacterium]|nr:thioredoxin domain-containing protein [Chloroflexota bacterium]